MYDRRYSQLPVIHQRENMVHGDKVSIMIIQIILIIITVEIILKVFLLEQRGSLRDREKVMRGAS